MQKTTVVLGLISLFLFFGVVSVEAVTCRVNTNTTGTSLSTSINIEADSGETLSDAFTEDIFLFITVGGETIGLDDDVISPNGADLSNLRRFSASSCTDDDRCSYRFRENLSDYIGDEAVVYEVYPAFEDGSRAFDCSPSSGTVSSNFPEQDPQESDRSGGAAAGNNNGAANNGLSAGDGVTDATFDTLNPLRIGNTGRGNADDPNPEDLTTPAAIISRFFTYAFPISGLILFVMLVWGGFETLSGAATQQSVDNGKQRITAAIFGFVLLFSSYWIAQIIQSIFKINIITF